jgi:hypothetical protein
MDKSNKGDIMRKILLILSFTLLTTPVMAACGGGTTTNYSLCKPSDGDTDWGTNYRTTMDSIDTQMKANEDDIDTNDTATALNTTHRTSNGSDHSFIDQDVTSGSTPTFTGTNITAAATATALVSNPTDCSAGNLANAIDAQGNLTCTDDKIGTLTNTKWCSSDGSEITCTEDAPAGSGDVTSVGDCTGGACYDGSSDGGTYSRIYDGDSHYVEFNPGNVTANRILTTRDAAGTLLISGDTLTGDVTATFDTDGSTAATIADSVTVTGWVLGTSSATQLTSPTLITNLIDTTGAADIDYGSADVTDHTFISDGGTVIVDGSLSSSGGSTAAGSLILKEDTDDGSNFYTVKGVATAADLSWILPSTNGTAGQVLEIASVSTNELTLEWDDDGGASSNKQICFIIDGGGSAVTTGAKAWVRAANSFTIGTMDITADQSGSCVIDLWKDTYANFPPDNSDSICDSGTCPTLSAAQKGQDSTLTSWTTSITAGDYIRANVDSCSTIEFVEVCIYE